MKLDHLQLPASVISSLYAKTLIETGEIVERTFLTEDSTSTKDHSPIVPSKENTIAFLGENKKHILITVNHDNLTYLPDEELSFLTNMLTACKLSVADTAIINLNKIESPSYKSIFESLTPSIVLLFGMEPSALSLPISFPQFQVQPFNNYTFLAAPTLSEIKEDKVLKSKLWVCLRRVFNV